MIVENDRFLRLVGDEDRAGRAVAVVRVARVGPFLPEDVEAACASSYEAGGLAWELVDIRPVQSRCAILAARGIYEIELPAHLTR